MSFRYHDPIRCVSLDTNMPFLPVFCMTLLSIVADESRVTKIPSVAPVIPAKFLIVISLTAHGDRRRHVRCIYTTDRRLSLTIDRDILYFFRY